MTLIEDIVTAPATLVALGLVLAGFLAWLSSTALSAGGRDAAHAQSCGRQRLSLRGDRHHGGRDISRSASDTLRKTQTGYLNWNVFGIVIGLIVTLGILALGA